MSFDTTHAIDSIKEGTKEVAETAQVKTSEFHEKYVSKVVPDCDKYGDAARFVAEMAPGVAEYNAIREGDWTGFAISAGIDVAALAAGALTVGTGYGAVKGGSIGAKAGAKAAKSASRELAEAGAKKAAKELAKKGAEKAIKESAEAGAKKIVQEAAETGAEKAAKELAEAGAEKAVKEMAEEGAEKAAKELAEAGAEKAAKELAEAGTEKAAKEIAEAGAEKAVKEVAEEGAEKAAKEVAEEGAEKAAKEFAEDGTEKAVKEVDEISEIVKHKREGIAREEIVRDELCSAFGEKNVLREQYIRDCFGKIIKDPKTNEGRRIDFIVRKGDKVTHSIEVTSKFADKQAQNEKTARILKEAKELGGAFIKDFSTGDLIEFPLDLVAEIWRLP